MSDARCSLCLALDETEMNAAVERRSNVIHYYALRSSASSCQYCKVLWDGIHGVGLGKNPSSVSYHVLGTLRLTVHDLLAHSGIEKVIEFYRDRERASRPSHHSLVVSNEAEAELESSRTWDASGRLRVDRWVETSAPLRNMPTDRANLAEKISPASSIKERDRPSNIWDESVRSQLCRWLGVASQKSAMPRRILDLEVNEKEVGDGLRLVSSENMVASYVALSHCWIGRTVPVTTKENLDARLQQIKLSSLSQTFQEVVKICRWLNMRYLWIDSLCIIQGDPVDWEDQAAQMDSIYENAFFTIAAHGPAGTSILPVYDDYRIKSTIPGLEEALYARMIPIHNFLSPVGVTLQSTGDEVPDEIHGRGWCYQERFLSRQTLHFTAGEVLHEDERGRIRCQCNDAVAHAFFLAKDKRPNLNRSMAPWEQWREIVTQYTEKAFSQPWDILPGIAGIARRYHRKDVLGEYVAGLWSGELARWLCWKSTQIALRGALRSGCRNCGIWPHRLAQEGPDARYVVPSFSWASRVGACEYLKEPWDGSYHQVCQINDVHVQSMIENPFGRFGLCSLRIHGRLISMVVLSTIKKDRRHVDGCRTEYAYLLDAVASAALKTCDIDSTLYDAKRSAHSLLFDAVDDIPEDGRVVYLVELFRSARSSVALVLEMQQDGDGSDMNQHFRRVGISVLPPTLFDEAILQREEIIIL